MVISGNPSPATKRRVVAQWLSVIVQILWEALLSLSKTNFILSLVLVQPRKTGKHPNMTKYLLTGT